MVGRSSGLFLNLKKKNFLRDIEVLMVAIIHFQSWSYDCMCTISYYGK